MLPGFEILEYGFFQRALIVGVLVGLVAGVLGVFLVLRGSAMFGDGLAHIAFGGIALGLFLGVAPVAMALAFAVVAGIGIQLLRERGFVMSDTGIAIFFTAGLALGVVLISLGPGLNVDVFGFLFGSIITVTREDVWVASALGLFSLTVVYFLYKEFFYLTFGEEDARAAGLPVRRLNLVFALLTSLAVVVAARFVGVLLISALLVLPAATVLQWTRSFRSAVVASGLLAVLAVLLGMMLAYWFDLATGGAIAMVSVSGFFLTLLVQRGARLLRAG